MSLGLFAQDSIEEKVEYPQITFESDLLDMGTIKEGEVIKMQFDFINSGKSPLVIELVTACKCTSLSWPEDAVQPNGLGSIFVTFDSKDYEGEVTKVIDIIANTDPIVVEARFTVNVVKAE